MTLNDFIKTRKYLVWSTTNYDGLSDDVIVEAVLNYGSWDDVQKIIEIAGIDHVANIFGEKAFRPRTNYRDDIRYYFDLYFKKHAPRYSH